MDLFESPLKRHTAKGTIFGFMLVDLQGVPAMLDGFTNPKPSG